MPGSWNESCYENIMSVMKEEFEMNLSSKIIIIVSFGLWVAAIFYIGSLGWTARYWGEQKSPLTTASPSSPPPQELRRK
jgi:hypothetical protein